MFNGQCSPSREMPNHGLGDLRPDGGLQFFPAGPADAGERSEGGQQLLPASNPNAGDVVQF